MAEPITDNIAELEQLILDTVDYYESDAVGLMARLVSDITSDLKQGKYKNRTGNLRRSIRVKLIDYNLSVKMAPYGYFLSFGVKGKKYKNAYGLTEEVATAFGKKKGSKFGSNKVWGIKPRNFYPDDIEDQIVKILLDE